MAGCSKKKNTGMRTPSPADELTEDLLVAILSRVPYRSLCRFKCVSKRWRSVTSHPDHRKMLPQHHLGALAGFLYSSYDDRYLPVPYFTGVSREARPAVNPSLLPRRDQLDILDSCNDLLLCRCYSDSHSETTDSRSFNYVVCNPATEQRVVFSPPGASFHKMTIACLGFDPAVSSHFHVFQFIDEHLDDDNDGNDVDDFSSGFIKGVEIYSSRTRVWSHHDNGWGMKTKILRHSRGVFVNGILHLVAIATESETPSLVNVDVGATTWRTIPMPQQEGYNFTFSDVGFIDLSQGRLHFADTDRDNKGKLSIWVLDDFSSEKWILKHTVKHFKLIQVGYPKFQHHIVAIHLERNTIFSAFPRDNKIVLMSSQLYTENAHIIGYLGPPHLKPYLTYTPLYSELLADGH